MAAVGPFEKGELMPARLQVFLRDINRILFPQTAEKTAFLSVNQITDIIAAAFSVVFYAKGDGISGEKHFYIATGVNQDRRFRICLINSPYITERWMVGIQNCKVVWTQCI